MNPTLKSHLGRARDSSVAAVIIRAVFRGDAVECPCCHSRFRVLRKYKQPNRICWLCGSMERHRVLWLYLDRHPELLSPGMSILHVAPERVLRRRFEAVPRVNYVGGDLTAEFGPERIDVTAIDYPDNSFDAVVCNHVLEHVPDDRLAMSEIRRVLKQGGWAVLMVPDVEEPATIEDPEVSDPDEQLRRFGQRDHVRRYGWDYVDRLNGAGFDVEVVEMDKVLSDAEVELYRLKKIGRVEPIFLCRPRQHG